MNVSDDQINVLQKALQVTFNATAHESESSARHTPVYGPELDERLSSALVQFLCEEVDAPKADKIIEILSTIATAL